MLRSGGAPQHWEPKAMRLPSAQHSIMNGLYVFAEQHCLEGPETNGRLCFFALATSSKFDTTFSRGARSTGQARLHSRLKFASSTILSFRFPFLPGGISSGIPIPDRNRPCALSSSRRNRQVELSNSESFSEIYVKIKFSASDFFFEKCFSETPSFINSRSHSQVDRWQLFSASRQTMSLISLIEIKKEKLDLHCTRLQEQT